MGSVGLGNNADLGAFLNRIFPEGLDLGRCQITQALGVYVADPTNTFRAGMVVMRNAAGLVVPSDGSDVLGVAKWNHATTLMAAVVDEAVVLDTHAGPLPETVYAPSYLKHPMVANVRVTSGLKGTGTLYTEDTGSGGFYTLNTTNGVITYAGTDVPPVGTALDSSTTVYVTYTWQITEADLVQMQGKNFWNTNDEVSQNESRITVITDAELIYTTQYDTAKVYTLSGANSNLYAATASGKAGLFTSDTAGSAKYVGRVFQVPTAADPFLGLRLIKQQPSF